MTVMNVDDSMTMRKIVTLALKGQGHVVVTKALLNFRDFTRAVGPAQRHGLHECGSLYRGLIADVLD